MESRYHSVAETEAMMIIILLAVHVFLAVIALWNRDLLVSIIALAAFSLMSALLVFFLDAPDVALTEAAVGAGVTSFLFVWFLRKTRRRDSE